MQLALDRRGFSLLEVLFATTILTVAVVTLAQVIALATRANLASRRTALASLFAAQKMEQLRALAWTYDASGAPVSDSTTAAVGLAASPPGVLDRDTAGYADLLDASGHSVLSAAAATFTRRWAITPLASHTDTLVLQVAVAPIGLPPSAGARLVTVKTRKGHHDAGF